MISQLLEDTCRSSWSRESSKTCRCDITNRVLHFFSRHNLSKTIVINAPDQHLTPFRPDSPNTGVVPRVRLREEIAFPASHAQKRIFCENPMIYLPGRQQARRKFEAIESELSYLLLQILSQDPSIRAVCR